MTTNRRTSAHTTATAAAADPRYPYQESERDFAFDIDNDDCDVARLGRAWRSEHHHMTGVYPEDSGNSRSGSAVDDNDFLLEGSNDGEGAGDGDDDDDADSWRKPGRQFRSNLMRLDAKNSFQLKPECAIERYYQVADRVRQCAPKRLLT